MINKTLEKELNLENWQVKKVSKLIDEGNTTFYFKIQEGCYRFT